MSQNDRKSTQLSSINVPLILVCVVLAGPLAYIFSGLDSRLHTVEVEYPKHRHDGLANDLAGLRREAILYNAASRERHDQQQRTIDEHRENTIDAFKGLTKRIEALESEHGK